MYGQRKHSLILENLHCSITKQETFRHLNQGYTPKENYKVAELIKKTGTI